MSEKIKHNILVISDAEIPCLVPKLLFYVVPLLRSRKMGFRRSFFKMAANAIKGVVRYDLIS